jgi:hypothetical protein
MIFIVAVTLVACLLALTALVLLNGPAELAAYEALLLVATLTLVGRFGSYPGSESLWLWRRKAQVARTLPPQLEALRRSVEFADNWALDADRKLVPRLRFLAEERLKTFHSVDINLHPWVARRLLGEDTWELLRPDRPESNDRSLRGFEMTTIGAAVAAIERLGPSPLQSISPPETLRIDT